MCTRGHKPGFLMSLKPGYLKVSRHRFQNCCSFPTNRNESCIGSETRRFASHARWLPVAPRHLADWVHWCIVLSESQTLLSLSVWWSLKEHSNLPSTVCSRVCSQLCSVMWLLCGRTVYKCWNTVTLPIRPLGSLSYWVSCKLSMTIDQLSINCHCLS